MRLRRRLLFSALISTMLLLLMEVAGRLVPPPSRPGLSLLSPGHVSASRYPQYTGYDPLLGWRQQAGVQIRDPAYQQWAEQWGLPFPPAGEVPVSSRGFRDTELAHPRPPDQQRILVLGDSSVWGSGAPRVSLLTERLEAALQPPDRRALEVINTGVPGYSTWQSLQILRESLALGLDGLIIYNLNSDAALARGFTDDAWFSTAVRAQSAAALRQLAVYRWLSHLLFEHRRQQTTGDQLRVHLAQYRSNLRTMIDLAAAEGAWTIGVIPPLRNDLSGVQQHGEVPSMPAGPEEQARFAAYLDGFDRKSSLDATIYDYRRAMAVEVLAAGGAVVDGPKLFTAAVAAHPERYVRDAALFVDPVHPSAEGHRLLAEALLPLVAARTGLSP